VKFARLGPLGDEIPVVVVGNSYLDLRPITDDVNGAFLASQPVERVTRAAAAGELHPLAHADGLRVASPIARPGAVICVGMNYAAHAAESGSAPPKDPVVFLKHPNTVVGPYDDVTIPRGSTKTDWEVELGVVIGPPAHALASPDRALAHVAGFVAVNDVSERAFQLELSGGQWSKGKCSPGFNPTGPWLVTPDEVAHGNLRLRSFVNEMTRQDSSTADMIFSVEFLVWHLSQFMRLEPGDLVLTGTPEGVALSGRFPYIAADDVVDIHVEGLGRQRQKFRAWEEAS
jgi:2-keto-4-pentenoate hydratase/2-oxohepta-3-ene-1,7-dioic acid hydratase in catechol pathway